MKRNFTRIFGLTAGLLVVFGCGFVPPGFSQSKPLTLTIPMHVTPGYIDLYSGVEKFGNIINTEGKGKVEAKLYHSETLYKVKDIVPALMNGSCEIVFHTSTHTTGSWPEVGGFALPFLFKSDAEAAERLKMGGQLLEILNQEMNRKYGVRILAAGFLPNIRIWTVKKKIEDPADVKGLKIRATGKPDAEAIHAFGGSPNFMSSGEMYEALQRGTIDGLTTYPGTIFARNLDEVIRFGSNMAPVFCAWGYQIYALSKTFGSWPQEIQNLILKAAQEYDKHTLSFAIQYEKEKIFPRLSKKIAMVSPSPEAMKKFDKLAAPTYESWLKTVNKDWGKKFIEASQTPLKK